MLLQNVNDGRLYLFEMQNGVHTADFNFGIVGTQWSVGAIGDFDGNMRSDIALRDMNTGELFLYLMQDDFNYVGKSLGNVSNSWALESSGDYNRDGTDDLLWRNTTTSQLHVWGMNNGAMDPFGSNSMGFLTSDLVII